MLSMILGWLGNLLGGPFAKAAVDAYKAKLQAENSADTIAATLAAKELEVQATEIQAQNQLRMAKVGKWYEPDHVMGYIACAYLGKIVVFDTMLGLGTTPAIHGWGDATLTMVVGAYFGKRGFENVARIIKR